MEDILYFDINSGISGDMTIASLLDLGVDEDKFLKELRKLNLKGYEIEISTVQKNGITAKDFKVILEDDSHPDQIETEQQIEKSHHQNSDDHQHEGGCKGCGKHNHADHSHSHHEDDHNHNHEDHSHGEGHSHSHSDQSEHLHRNFNDIKELINQSDLSQKVKELSIDIFAEVAEAEAKVHNKELNEVHFHEVGAVDSIVDIV